MTSRAVSDRDRADGGPVHFDGGKNKDTRACGIFLAIDVAQLLPVDIEKNIDTGRQYLLNGLTRSAIVITKNFCVFENASLLIISLNSS